MGLINWLQFNYWCFLFNNKSDKRSQKSPASSRCSGGTLPAAWIIGTDPKYPLVTPMRREKRQGQAGWDRVGSLAGYTHMTNRGMKTTLRQEKKSRRPPDQSYGSAARIWGDSRSVSVRLCITLWKNKENYSNNIWNIRAFAVLNLRPLCSVILHCLEQFLRKALARENK